MWRSLEKPVAVAETLNNLGFPVYEQGHMGDARRTCTESLALFRSQGSKSRPGPCGQTLTQAIAEAFQGC